MTTLLATEVFKNPATLDIYVHVIITKMPRLGWGTPWKNGRVTDTLLS